MNIHTDSGDVTMHIDDDSDDEKSLKKRPVKTSEETKESKQIEPRKRSYTRKETMTHYGTPKQIAEYEDAEGTVEGLTRTMWCVAVSNLLTILMTIWTLGSITDHLSIALLVLTVIVTIYKTIELSVFFTKRAIFNRPLSVVDKDGYMIPTPDGDTSIDEEMEDDASKKSVEDKSGGKKMAHYKSYSKMADRLTSILITCSFSVVSIVIWFFILLIQIMFELRSDTSVGPTGVFDVFGNLTQNGQAVYILIYLVSGFSLLVVILAGFQTLQLREYYSRQSNRCLQK